MILGIAGTFSAGKDIAAEYLAEEHNFLLVSTGDMVRELSQRLHGSIDRHLLKRTADEARTEHGAGYFVEQAIQKFEASTYNHLAITGIRSIGEAELLKSKDGTLLFVDAPLKLRYERSVARGRGDKETSFDEFKHNEDIEMAGRGKDKTVINIGAMKTMADHTLHNDADLGSYFAKIEEVLLLY